MLPSVRWKVAAARSTSAGGGSSLTKRRASLVAMKRAVAGCRARMSITRSPSSRPPPAGITWPSTRFSPRSWAAVRKTKPPPCCGRSMVQPVKQRATSTTSCWL